MTRARVQVCVPWRAGDPGRAEGWNLVRRTWERTGWTVSVADSDPELPFNRSQARNRAAASGDWQVAVFADACILVTRMRTIEEAIAISVRGDRLVHGHTSVRRLTREASELVIAGGRPEHAAVARRNGPRVPGGIVVVTRRLFERVGGYDEAFEGWGGEDGAFVAACTKGTGRRNVSGIVYHLWHGHSDRDLGSDAYARNRARAAAAWADPA